MILSEIDDFSGICQSSRDDLPSQIIPHCPLRVLFFLCLYLCIRFSTPFYYLIISNKCIHLPLPFLISSRYAFYLLTILSFVSSIFFINHQVHFVMSTYSLLWGHPLEHPPWTKPLKKIISRFSPRNHQW